MNNKILFYEDCKIMKKYWFLLTALFIFGFLSWTFIFILSVIKLPFNNNLTMNVMLIIFLSLTLGIIIFLFIFRYTGNKFQYSLSITNNTIYFDEKFINKNKYLTTELKSFLVIYRINNLAKISFSFTDKKQDIIIYTHKANILIATLEKILEENQKQDK